MHKCWADNLGSCEGKISGEHIISKGIFTGKFVNVQGFPWNRGEIKAIGINSITSNILCTHHNNSLSIVDNEGIDLFRAIRRFEEILSGRNFLINQSTLNHIASGKLLEQWFIKHAINLFIISSKGRCWYNGSKANAPPLDIIEAAFGNRALEYPRGLYNYAGSRIGEQKIVEDQILFTPIFNPNNMYVGAAFEFQALSFIIWLGDLEQMPWIEFHKFYHHMGGHFEKFPIRASCKIDW